MLSSFFSLNWKPYSLSFLSFLPSLSVCQVHCPVFFSTPRWPPYSFRALYLFFFWNNLTISQVLSTTHSLKSFQSFVKTDVIKPPSLSCMVQIYAKRGSKNHKGKGLVLPDRPSLDCLPQGSPQELQSFLTILLCLLQSLSSRQGTMPRARLDWNLSHAS